MVYIRRLIWDDWNVLHIAQHHVTPDEVENICHGPYMDGEANKGRIFLIGPTGTGRMLAAILDPEPEQGVYYPVSARTASRKERRQYQEGKAGEQE